MSIIESDLRTFGWLDPSPIVLCVAFTAIIYSNWIVAMLEERKFLADDSTGSQKTALLDLPNELLIHVLYCFTTLPLLHMRSVNHRFQNLIIRIVHGRLLLAASLKDHKLILECYHPSAQYTEPYVLCDYLGTPGLSDTIAGQGSIYAAHSGDGLLRNLYSHFRPTRRRPDSKAPRPHPAGDIPGSRTSDIATSRSERQDDADEDVKRIINLDASENFSQLVFSTDLVQLGPRRGVFSDIVKVNDKTTLRIFRQWAAHQAAETRRSPTSHPGESKTRIAQDTRDSVITWIDDLKKKAGLKIRVEERKWRREAPILLRKDEEQAVSYSMELQEVQISTVHLLLAIEKNILQKEQNDSGKAMVFGTFVGS